MTATGSVGRRELAVERRALRLSRAGAALAARVAWSVTVRQQVLLLDGVYALLGVVVSLLTLRAARLVAVHPFRTTGGGAGPIRLTPWVE